jgi:hypothetical protein
MCRQLSMLVFVPTVVAAAFSFSPLANAAAQRTFVASFGSSANTAFNCSLTKPCRAFSEAIGVTNPKGEVVVLDSAGYGTVTITKSVSIIAPPGIYAGISVFSGDGITVNAGVTDIVVLRGLSINGQGGAAGIDIQHAARVRIEGCLISDMGSNGIIDTASGELIVLDTVVRDNGGTGIEVTADASVVLDHVRSEHNVPHGFHIVPSTGTAKAAISDSVFAHNSMSGISENGVASGVTYVGVEHSVLADNAISGFDAQNSTFGTVVMVLTRSEVAGNHNLGVSAVGITAPNSVNATLTENTFVGPDVGLYAYGDGVQVYLGSNKFSSFGGSVTQVSGAFVGSYGNNVGSWIAAGTITPVSGH